MNMQTNTTFSKIVKKPRQATAPIKAKTNKPKHIDKRGALAEPIIECLFN